MQMATNSNINMMSGLDHSKRNIHKPIPFEWNANTIRGKQSNPPIPAMNESTEDTIATNTRPISRNAIPDMGIFDFNDLLSNKNKSKQKLKQKFETKQKTKLFKVNELDSRTVDIVHSGVIRNKKKKPTKTNIHKINKRSAVSLQEEKVQSEKELIPDLKSYTSKINTRILQGKYVKDNALYWYYISNKYHHNENEKICRNWVHQIISNTLNQYIMNCLSKLWMYQCKAKTKGLIKAKQGQRLLTGLREIHRHTKREEVKAIILAPNVDYYDSDNNLDEQITSLKLMCKEQNIPFIYGLSKKKLRFIFQNNYIDDKNNHHYYSKKPIGVVVAVGIINIQGANEEFKNVIIEWKRCVEEYNMYQEDKILHPSIFDLQRVILETKILNISNQNNNNQNNNNQNNNNSNIEYVPNTADFGPIYAPLLSSNAQPFTPSGFSALANPFIPSQ